MLDALPHAVRNRLRAQCDEVELAVDDVLADAKTSRRHVHFPQDGLIGVLAGVDGHAPLEIALIGREAMEGAMRVFAGDAATTRSVVLVEGHALRLSVRQFQRHLDASPALRRGVSDALAHLFAQVVQAVPCTRFHALPSRLALLLLRAYDRTGVSELPFTHRRLAELLGVQRSAVTLAAGQLNRQGVIRYARGHLEVVDHRGLTRLACACYATHGRAPHAWPLPGA